MDQAINDFAPQGSETWAQERCGKATASRIADIMRKGKNGQSSASRTNYLAQLVTERLTNSPCDGFQSKAMLDGIEREPQARNLYAFIHGEVEQCGFIQHPRIAMSGASPDGRVGSAGLVQFKCPEKAKHLDTLLRGMIDGDYQVQMQWEIGTDEREWCDYVSFNPEFPASMQLWRKRVPRDEARIAELERDVTIFLAEVADTVEKLNRIYGEASSSLLLDQLRASVALTDPPRGKMIIESGRQS